MAKSSTQEKQFAEYAKLIDNNLTETLQNTKEKAEADGLEVILSGYFKQSLASDKDKIMTVPLVIAQDFEEKACLRGEDLLGTAYVLEKKDGKVTGKINNGIIWFEKKTKNVKSIYIGDSELKDGVYTGNWNLVTKSDETLDRQGSFLLVKLRKYK